MRITTTVAVLVLSGCTESTEQITLEPFLVPCVGVDQAACMIGTTSTTEVVTFYDAIEGFVFVWGETHRVTYTSQDVSNPPEDGSSVRFEMTADTLISTALDSDEFTLRFQTDSEPWFDANGSGRSSFSGNTIDCDPLLCSALETRTDAYVLRLRHGASPGAVATAIAIE